MFEIGRRYENRIGHFVVLSISGSKLYVRYYNGTTASLDTKIQENIVNNLYKERANLALGAGNKGDKELIHLPSLWES